MIWSTQKYLKKIIVSVLCSENLVKDYIRNYSLYKVK